MDLGGPVVTVDGDTPKYEQVARRIEALVDDGTNLSLAQRSAHVDAVPD